MRAAIVAAVLLLATAARADEHVAYVDQTRAINECAEAKKVIAELGADREARDKARAEAAKTKKTLSPADDAWAAAEQQKAATAEQGIRARLRRVAEAVRKAKKLTVVRDASGTVALDPALDLTAEVIRRLDAGEGRDPAVADGEIKALREKLATLEAARTPAKVQAEGKPGAR
jgi:Skp family chaperone for outer membrane proteins